MPNFVTAGFFFALATGAGAVVACSDDGTPSLEQTAVSAGSHGGKDSADAASNAPPAEERLFRAVEKDLEQKCGGACHTMASYKPTPGAFLRPPDAYASIKAYPGVVVADYYQSSLLAKGAHAGPAIGDDPTFEANVIEWLKMESALLQSQRKASIDAVSLVAGANDIDMTKASANGLTGVHFLFDASLTSGVLSLSNLRVRTAAGTAVHIVSPSFVRVLAARDSRNRTEVPDGAASFSNIEQTVAGGADTPLGPGSVFFTSPGWIPFDFAGDKIRIEVDKLEPGTLSLLDTERACKDVAGFAAKVLPSMRGAGTFNLNCAGCHGDGLAGLALNGADNGAICSQVLQKLDEGDVSKSIIVNKVKTGSAHTGGSITDLAGWTALFVNNKGVFF